MFALQLCLITVLVAAPAVYGHARLRDPPARTSAFHLGFPKVPPEYSDFQLNCGGYEKKVQLNGACGICGDPADANPRQGERPNGKFATNTIVRTYTSGSIIEVDIEMQANHLGWFYFRICPATSPDVEVTQACLDSNTLDIVEAPTAVTDKKRWEIPNRSVGGGGIYKFKVQLPSGLKCERCVLQWDWLCNNRPGQKIQETFRGCADVKIQ